VGVAVAVMVWLLWSWCGCCSHGVAVAVVAVMVVVAAVMVVPNWDFVRSEGVVGLMLPGRCYMVGLRIWVVGDRSSKKVFWTRLCPFRICACIFPGLNRME